MDCTSTGASPPTHTLPMRTLWLGRRAIIGGVHIIVFGGGIITVRGCGYRWRHRMGGTPSEVNLIQSSGECKRKRGGRSAQNIQHFRLAGNPSMRRLLWHRCPGAAFYPAFARRTPACRGRRCACRVIMVGEIPVSVEQKNLPSAICTTYPVGRFCFSVGSGIKNCIGWS